MRAVVHVLRSAGSAAMAGAIFLPLASCKACGKTSYLRAADSTGLLIALALPAALVVASLFFAKYAEVLAAFNFAAGLFALVELVLATMFFDDWQLGGYLAATGIALVTAAGVLEMINVYLRDRQRRRGS
jgi:hypothetical protein